MTTTETQTIATNVRRLRDELGLSQEALAAIAGMSKATVQKVEQARPAYGSTLRRIAKALDTTVAGLRRDLTQEQADILFGSILEQNALLRQALDQGNDRLALELADELSRMLEVHEP